MNNLLTQVIQWRWGKQQWSKKEVKKDMALSNTGNTDNIENGEDGVPLIDAKKDVEESNNSSYIIMKDEKHT